MRPGRGATAAGILTLAVALLAGCATAAPNPTGSGGLVGRMSGTSDVEGQPGDPAAGGGGLAVIPVAAMDGPFWQLTGEEQVADPREWSYLTPQLSEEQVTELGGAVALIDGTGAFRVIVPAGEYAVCYWPGDVGGRVTGCDAIDLPAEGELDATWGEAGFHISVAG